MSLENFDVYNFVIKLGSLEEMTSVELLDKIATLNIENRKEVLKNDVIKNKLRYGLLFESHDNQWYYYREILKKITPSEFLSLYNFEYLTKYFTSTIYNEEKYKFYASLCESDVNDVVKFVLEDKEFYEDFFKYSDGFYSLFENLNYELFKEVILKMQTDGYKLNGYFLNNVSADYQFDILGEAEINDDTLLFLIPYFNIRVKSYFFENDNRAIYLYNKFDIPSLLQKGIKFNNEILKKQDFFDLLKSDSFILFRININNIEKNNNPLPIEAMLEKYYEEIISLYDKKSDLFNEYSFILGNPGISLNKSYICDEDIIDKINYNLNEDISGNLYYCNKPELINFLKNETSKKLSEVIIDALFRDNIYNVWLNIKEMLRFNSIFTDDKIIDSDKELFYNMILNIDKLDNSSKIELYNSLKDKNFSLVFYSDLRKVKDIAYDKIKDDLINPSLHDEYIDKEKTAKLGVPVYDLRDKEFTMLVRTQDNFREIDHYKRGCYSIISNENTQVFGEYDTSSFVYGYNSFDNGRVLHMFESDSYSSNFKDEPSRYVNRIMTSEELVKTSPGYSEVQILNVKSEKRKHRWYAKKPDFIVVFNMIGDKQIKESKRLNIPIVIISRKKLDKKQTVDSCYDVDVDAYVRNIIEEREHKARR